MVKKSQLGKSKSHQFRFVLASLLLSIYFLPTQATTQDALLRFLSVAETEIDNLIPDSSLIVPNNVGWFDQPEARIGTGTNTGSGPRERQNSYAVRVRPIFGNQRNAERNLNRLATRQYELDYQTLFNDALENRYYLLIQMLELQTAIEFHNQELDLIRTELDYDQSLIQTDAFDAEHLQELEVEKFQLQQQVTLETERLRILMQESRAPANLVSLLESRSEWLISHEEIIQNSGLEALRAQFPSLEESRGNLRVQNDALALDMEEEELKRERAERYPPLRFVELKYTDKSQQQGNEAEATLSFNIPFGGRKNAFTKEVRDIASARTDLLISQRDTIRALNEQRNALQFSVGQLTAINQTISFIDERLVQSENFGSPRMILVLRKERLEQEHQQAQLRLQAMQSYISLLHTSGQLVMPPLRNWLQSE